MYIWSRGGLAGSLGQSASPENDFTDCTGHTAAIEAAFKDARRAVNHAAAVLGTAYGKSTMSNQTRQVLNKHFHTTDRDHLLEIFRNIFRIRQALEKGLSFECEKDCGGGTRCGYAWATQWFGGFGKIHLCFDSRPKTCSFTKLTPQEQAALIIHEAAHRHVGIDDKVYVWEQPPLSKRDYSKLTAEQAMDNADSYAWLCVEL